MSDHATQAPADDSTAPEPPSAALPVGLILAGLIFGLLIACNGFINALTPEPETIDIQERAGSVALDAPKGMALTLSATSGDVGTCTVKDPNEHTVAIHATKDTYGNSEAHFTADPAGTYTVTCPSTMFAEVTNPAAADQSKAEENDMRNGKVWGIALGGVFVATGITAGVVRNRRYDREKAAYRAATQQGSGEPK